MAIRRYPYFAGTNFAVRPICYYECDTAAELPVAGASAGDTAYAIDTTLWYFFDGSSWTATGGGGGTPVGGKVWLTSPQSVPNLSGDYISWSALKYGTAGIFNPITPTHIIAPVDGKYQLVTMIQWENNAVGDRNLSIGLSSAGPAIIQSQSIRVQGSTFTGQWNQLVMEEEMTAGDYWLVNVEQNSGGPLNVKSGLLFGSWATLRKVG